MKLNVIVPFFNTKPLYLRECLDSIYRQSFQDFKILLINDGSFRYNYSNIVSNNKILYLKNPVNLGVCKSVNLAFSRVNSEYCIRVDSDDIIDPLLFEKEISFLSSNEKYVGICCDIDKFYGSNKKHTHVIRPDNWNLDDITRGKFRGYGYAGGMMFRSYVLSKIFLNEEYHICEDFEFHVKLLRFGKIHSLHENLYHYRKHDSQITGKFGRAQRAKYIQDVINRIRKKEL